MARAVNHSRPRSVKSGMTLESLKQDLAYAIRGLRMKPGFTIAVVTTLGLGIGANAAMFGIVDRLLVRQPAFMKDPATAHHLYLYQTRRATERPCSGHDGRCTSRARWTTSFASIAG